MKKLLSLLCLLFSWSVASAADSNVIPPDQAFEWLAKTPDAMVLDVRTAEEFSGGHLAKAVLIPWGSSDFESRVAKLDPRKPVLVYCRSGRRSTAAVKVLAKLGFTVVRNLDGGIIAWEKAGKPLVKPE